VGELITVAASNRYDQRISIPGWWASNYGSCVDLFAPVEDDGGTSLATPMVSRSAHGTLCGAVGSHRISTNGDGMGSSLARSPRIALVRVNHRASASACSCGMEWGGRPPARSRLGSTRRTLS
jgi:hypothetical protein